jgi:DNA polymerase alpha-associated DNA helicase A
MKATDIPTFAATQVDLLDLELQAEVAESNTLIAQTSPTALQRAGAAIVNLNISSQRTGLGGKTVLDLELDPAVGGGDIPEHGIRVGDIVGVQEQPSGSARKKEKTDSQRNGVNGVVLKVQPGSVSVALDKEDVDVPGGKLWMWVSFMWLGMVEELICTIVSNLLMMLLIRGMLMKLMFA